MSKRRMHFITLMCVGPTNHHNGGWRHPDSDGHMVLDSLRQDGDRAPATAGTKHRRSLSGIVGTQPDDIEDLVKRIHSSFVSVGLNRVKNPVAIGEYEVAEPSHDGRAVTYRRV